MVAGTGRPAAASSVGAKSTWLTSSLICDAAVEAGPFDDQRNVDRAFVRAAFVLRVARVEVARRDRW